jgi:hypothetical protein
VRDTVKLGAGPTTPLCVPVATGRGSPESDNVCSSVLIRSSPSGPSDDDWRQRGQ